MSAVREHVEKGTVSIVHGAKHLAAVDVVAYNAELRDAEGFVGDRASNRAFRAILDDLRDRLRKNGEDPLGDTPTEEISKKKLDKILTDGDPTAAGLVHGAIEEFAGELATVTKRFLKMKEWKGTQRIMVGGGLRASRIGELAIGRAGVLLREQGVEIELVPIRHHPDEAGLIGGVHLAPPWMFAGHSGILAVDIGGSNIRAGVVRIDVKKDVLHADAAVVAADLWRHREEKPTRKQAVDRMAEMLEALVARAAKEKVALAPFLGVGCPGVIEEDGAIDRGGQNLPGNWESAKFNLVGELLERIPKIGDHPTTVVMHNDAVVQGLSEVPFQTDVTRWGVLTIGTGLGNACYENHG